MIIADSHFFFELDSSPPTGAGFGPDSSSPSTNYQVTSWFPVSGARKAIAAFSAYILAVPRVDNRDSAIDSFQLPKCDKGDWIGELKGDFGLDIVLDNGIKTEEGFALNLDYVCAEKWVFNTTSDLNSPSPAELERYRENIRMFLNSSSYYGLHSDGTITVMNYNDISVNHATPNFMDSPYLCALKYSIKCLTNSNCLLYA